MASIRAINTRKKTKRKTKKSATSTRALRYNNVRLLPPADQRLKSLLDLSAEWYWEQDEQYRFTQLTGGAFEKLGFCAQDYLGTTRWDHGGMPVGSSGNWDEHKAVLKARQPFTNFVFTRTDAKGVARYISSSGQPIFDADGRFKGYRGIACDITERRRDERLLTLEHIVNRTLATAENLTSALKGVMRAVCESEAWECGRYYRVDEKAGLLRCVEAWGVSDPAVERYLAALRARALPLERGLKGRTYHAREPQWEPDTGRHETMAKTHLGGSRDTFIVPAIAEGKVIGMMCFTNRVVREPDARLLQAARVIGSQIGQFVQRKQAEEVLRESEARFRSLTVLSSDWFWEQDADFRFTRLEGRHVTGDGAAFKSEQGKTPEEIGMEVEGGWATYRALLAGHQPFRDVVMWRTAADGHRSYMNVSGEPIFDAGGRFTGYRGVGADISERKRGEQLLALEHTVNRGLTKAKSLSDAVTTSLRAVCESEGWECGRYFRVDEKAGLLRFAEAWGVVDPSIERYIAASRDVTYTRGAGLTGRVWESGEPMWVSERGQHAGVSQKVFGAIRDVFIFPLIADGKTVGVWTFISRKIRTPDARLLQAVRVIGGQVGQFVQRKQAEEVLRESEARFRSLTGLSSDWFWEQDADLRFTRFEGRHVSGDSSGFIGELGKTYEEVEVQIEGGWEAHHALLAAHQPFRDVVMWRASADGGRSYVSISGEPIFDGNGRFIGYRGVGADISDRKRAEQLRALEHKVNRSLAVAENLSVGLQSVLRAVCESEGWECGRYFHVDENAGLMHVLEDWGIDDPAVRSYLAASRQKSPSLHRGVKGRAWSTCEPLWGSETNRQSHLSEKHLGSARAAFAFPAISEGKAIGIVSFTSRDLREPDPRLLQAMRVIGSQIGQFVQRKRAEQQTLRLANMFAALSATNDAIVHAKSIDELYQQVCDAAVHGGRFSNTSILIVEPDSRRMKAVASAGQILQEIRVSLISVDETIPEGQGLVGIAFRTQKLTVSNDFLNDERTRPWHEIGRKVNCRSAAALPLIQNGRSVGVVLIHYDELNAFDDQTVKLLERMAENVSFALDNFEREAERRRAQDRIQYLATHDGLTDLPNRVMFSQVLNLAIESARRYNRHFAVLFVDLDRFKIINDTLGHEAGDMLLKEMSRRIKDNLRASDVVARLGGDEFVVLVQEVNEPEQVAIVARKLLSAAIKPMMIMGQECRVTASVGICMYPTDAEDEQALMKNADIAMYLAKEEGKNNFQFYSKDIKTQSLERLTLETNLRRALEREEFYLHYQAKLDLTTGAITGVEALVRWKHPELGTVSPLQFIPLAEETGLIVPIGKWVLRTACMQNVAWQRAGLAPVCMAVNLSPRQFADENLLRDLAGVLDQTGMNPQLLELEITESMVMGNVDRAAKQLNAIKQMGVRLAIDDFGTGYSSLAQIKRFPIDTIKVDRSFIREIPADSEDKAITEAIIAMGRSLSLTVVAEGVETEEQQNFLRDHACNEMQGYYFSKPVAPDQFAELLRTHVPSPKK